ncbi:MAG TPA: hypothetical protein VMU95_28560 [Trebonia sp.]|nr:hypothetical protein [Trebonia sp.]
MRHFFGVVLAVLLAAAVFFVATWGYVWVFNGVEASAATGSGQPAANGGGLPAYGHSLFSNGHVMAGGGALLAVGLITGLLMVMPRVSPLATGLPGLVLVAWSVLYVSDVAQAIRLIPLRTDDFGTGFEVLLSDGLLGAAGLALIAPLFVPSRWRPAARALGYRVQGASALVRPAGGPSGTGSSDASPTITMTGFPLPSAGSDPPPGWSSPRRAPGPVTPPDGSQPPWGPPDRS